MIISEWLILPSSSKLLWFKQTVLILKIYKLCVQFYLFQKKNKQYFASLRDESPQRPKALSPEIYQSLQSNYIMPKDTLAGGTWFGINEYKNVIILLNGGFENHERKSSYLKSRGQIVKELLLSIMPVVDWQLMDLIYIEPFTLVVWSDEHLFELVWDGKIKHRKVLDTSISHIWSSSTLYDKQAKIKREELFQNWIAMSPPISKRSILNFFKEKVDAENGFIINRNEKMKTLSYSFIELSGSSMASLDYFDLQNFKHISNTLELVHETTNCIID
jgi:hypothetical protein